MKPSDVAVANKLLSDLTRVKYHLNKMAEKDNENINIQYAVCCVHREHEYSKVADISSHDVIKYIQTDLREIEIKLRSLGVTLE